MSKNLKIKIGDVCISIIWDFQGCSGAVLPAYRPFVEDGNTDIMLRLHHGVPDAPIGKEVFDCSPIWTLYRQNELSVIKIFDQLSVPDKTLVYKLPLINADLYYNGNHGQSLDPFDGPVMELLMINYLAQRNGVILHGCGIEMVGEG